jgi:hypothetical protein
MSKAAAEKTFVFFKVDDKGPDLASTAGRIQRSEELTLVNTGDTALVVKGRPSEVKKFALNLDGWRAEANTSVR